ncbi:uncharacterized protein K441DRAFT_691838 [Cenococcum geophilum 1.58]|uniref:uncharacterized protein n=1 Tax=Cenococcum geophilum 1.58 TaxID=794803 RepID=UPI00358F9C3E|nr:hypothetical protein K441DRAFT_691838 [Cenococcum geophilum 1.58]
MPLSNNCTSIANELTALIDSVQVTGTGARRIWQNVYNAGRRQWDEKQMADLQKRLDRVGGLICNHIVVHKQNEMLTDLEQLSIDMTEMKSNRASDVDKNLVDFRNVFRTVEEEIWERDTVGGLSSRIPSKMNVELPVAVGKWLDLQTDCSVLKQLRFYAIDDRFSEISSPYPKTYEWILNHDGPEPDVSHKSNPNFAQWLGLDNSTYWISGKPGSGKSTIMKYISNHPRTIQLLQPWASGCNISTASFFFWNPAKERLQKSQAGLLRSLLYQLFSKYPDQIRLVFSDVWDLIRNGERGALANLNSLLDGTSCLQVILGQVMTRLKNNGTKLIFFIDGLDEYEAKPSEIISLINDLKESHAPYLKLCLASRPWNEFEDAAFGKNNPWKLELHKFTENDIARYVRELLGRNDLYHDLTKHDYRCPDLVQAIVNAAQGIFLWVKLVVCSLLEGLTNSDRVGDLLNRLYEIPTDLNKYFERILESIDDRYRQDSARFFLVASDAQLQLPLMIYWHIHESDPSICPPGAANISKIVTEHDVAAEFVDMETSGYRLEQMRRRLTSRCKHLLEAAPPTIDLMKHSYYGGPVEFLHRTVRDFLQRPDIRQRLCNWARDFDVDGAVCKGITTQIRLTPLFRDPYVEDRWPSQLAGCLLWHAGHLQAKGSPGNPGIKFATEFLKLLKAHALQHEKVIESYFQGTDNSHSDPANPNAPFDKGAVAARLRLTHLVFPDAELSGLAVSYGRAHPAWKRRSSSTAQEVREGQHSFAERAKSGQSAGNRSQEGRRSRHSERDLPPEGQKTPQRDLTASLKKFFRIK